MWELDGEEIWALKNWCFWIVVLEKTLKSPLDCKKIQSVHPKGNQSWIFIGRTDVEAEIPILWPPDAKNWLIGNDPDAGKDWRWEKGTTENEVDWWASSTQQAWVWVNSGSCWWIGSLACCSLWGCKELDMTDWLNWTVFYLKWPSLVTWPLSLAVPPVHCGLWIILILSWVAANCHFKKGGISPSLSFPLLVGKGYHR